ncbi:Calcium/calmodulin-dependent protein kinase kinase cmkC [Golovinomyces cichoracearum]|uniref:Calcium/calmodulin-dependent protein kinase kinase cmkC n=1 Tax=Golovinomyces cichoracearum TaxID=62708 RepID=A0A420IHV4_9PEZI|nr:Calcium/calmodulin-dependent protein kinase kinase cmkC [Golovinomyces cichoracearum]
MTTLQTQIMTSKSDARKNHGRIVKVKETLNATSKYVKIENGKTELHLNQYVIKEQIGRGSFGAVHLAQDQFGTEYAIKELSKSRLRRNSRSKFMKRIQHDRVLPESRYPRSKSESLSTAANIYKAELFSNPLDLISGEIEALKRTNHPNIVRLFEVLDDPEEDSIYMVLEICKKGVISNVAIGKRVDPQPIENCRRWFQQMIHGISHLHNQGIVHRDIKPENLLLTDDDVLKIVDFGISEIFDKGSDMMVFKSAGSPAFTPPELCVPKHGYVSGRAADIWSIGVSIYCLRFGYLPFEHTGILEIYDAIRNEELKLDIDPIQEPEFKDLMTRLLDKNPKTRISMDEIKIHPWFTKNNFDPLPAQVQEKPKHSISIRPKIISDEQLNNKTTLCQSFGREMRELIPSLVFNPIHFSGIPQSSDLSLRMMGDSQGPYSKTTIMGQNLENPDPMLTRQRNDSGIVLETNELSPEENLKPSLLENDDPVGNKTFVPKTCSF